MKIQKISLTPQRLISALIPWSCWLCIYSGGIPGVSVGYLLVILVDVLAFKYSISKRYPYSNSSLFIFYLYCVISIPLSLFMIKEVVWIQIANRVLKQFLLVFTICYVFPRHLEFNYFLKSYQRLAFAFAIVLVFQYVLYKSVGVSFEVKIPFLSYVNEWSDAKNFALEMAKTGRMTSVFLEPSHYCYFIFPIIIINLFGSEKRNTKSLLKASFFSITVLLSAASSGVIIAALIWGAYILNIIVYKGNSTRKVIALILSLSAVCVGIYLINNNPVVSFSIQRLMPSYSSSENVWSKIEGGKYLFDNLPIFLKLIGHGFGNMNSEFMTGYYYTLYNCGLIGTLLLIIWLINSFCKTNIMGRVTVVVFIILMFVTMPLYDLQLLLYCALISTGEGMIKS